MTCGFSAGFVVRVDEPVTVQAQAPRDLRDRSASDHDAIHSEFERDP